MRMSNQSGLTFVQSARNLDFTGFLASNDVGSVQSGLNNVKSVASLEFTGLEAFFVCEFI